MNKKTDVDVIHFMMGDVLTPNARHSFFVAAAVQPRVAVKNRATPTAMQM